MFITATKTKLEQKMETGTWGIVKKKKKSHISFLRRLWQFWIDKAFQSSELHGL